MAQNNLRVPVLSALLFGLTICVAGCGTAPPEAAPEPVMSEAEAEAYSKQAAENERKLRQGG